MTLLTIKEAARRLSVTPRTLALWREKRRGPRFFRVGVRVRYCLEDLNAWVKARAVETKGF
jgi:excisionase family DNA binding protein